MSESIVKFSHRLAGKDLDHWCGCDTSKTGEVDDAYFHGQRRQRLPDLRNYSRSPSRRPYSSSNWMQYHNHPSCCPVFSALQLVISGCHKYQLQGLGTKISMFTGSFNWQIPDGCIQGAFKGLVSKRLGHLSSSMDTYREHSSTSALP